MKKMNSKPKVRKKRGKGYTKGELNKLIDSLCHPFFKTNKGFILVDGLLHGVVEQDPPETVKKFLKYNIPKIMQQISKKAKEDQLQP